MESSPFGYSFLVDLYDVQPGLCNDIEFTYRMLEELVDLLKMTKQCPPYVIHGPTHNGEELFPDKVGVSAWIGLIESGIQVHTIQPRNFVSIDIYSCGKVDEKLTLDFLAAKYKPKNIESEFVVRGISY